MAGATPRRRRRLNVPSSGTGSPYSVRSPTSLERTKFTTRSARSGRTRISASAKTGPIGERTRMFGGVRTASRTLRAPPSARS